MTKNRNWELAKLGLVAIVVIALGFLLASRFVSPAPPHTISLASGQPGGAYSLFAEQYREELAKNEIHLEILHTQGSVENLELLTRGAADLAMVQSGVANLSQKKQLLSLGSVFLEPLWVFLPRDSPVQLLSELAGLRLEIGPDGSGTRALAKQILALNNIEKTAILHSTTGPRRS